VLPLGGKRVFARQKEEGKMSEAIAKFFNAEELGQQAQILELRELLKFYYELSGPDLVLDYEGCRVHAGELERELDYCGCRARAGVKQHDEPFPHDNWCEEARTIKVLEEKR
jgi:hypothetical protein